MTQIDKLMDSIGGTIGEMSASDIVVKCWHKFPETFGLEGYKEKYPDSNKVLILLMGERGLINKGWLRKVRNKTYEVTEVGKSIWNKMNGIDHGYIRNISNITIIELSKEQDELLTKLFNSEVYYKMLGNKNEITFKDACLFWGINGKRKEEASQTLNDLEIKLEEILNLGGNYVLKNGRSTTCGDVRVLKNIDSYLKTQFERYLNLVKEGKKEC